MNDKTIVEQAIANIAATSEALEKYSRNVNNFCSPFTANLLERMSWELHRKASDLAEMNYAYIEQV